jgi:hypothetical protein
MATTNMTVKLTANDKGNPPGKLAEAELHFTEGPLEGLKLIGFAIWETRDGARRNATFPARQYTVNGERRSFALLRAISDATAQARIRDLSLPMRRMPRTLRESREPSTAGAPSLALRLLHRKEKRRAAHRNDTMLSGTTRPAEERRCRIARLLPSQSPIVYRCQSDSLRVISRC